MQRKVPFKQYWMIAVISVAVAIGLNNILLILNIAKYSKAYQEAAEMLYSPPFMVQILYAGILMPVVEELVFRGAIFKLLRRWIAFSWAMLISAVLFGLYHGNLVQFIYASLCGMLLAYLYEKFGSIKAPILAHMTANLTACIMTEFGAFTWVFAESVRMILVTIICILVASTIFVYIQRMEKELES